PEGNTGSTPSTPFTFTVTRSGDVSGTTTATYTVADSGTNPAIGPDYVGGAFPTETVTFASGVTTQTITIDVNGDTVVEPDEGFTVTLSSPSPSTIPLSPSSATGTTQNADSTTLALHDTLPI